MGFGGHIYLINGASGWLGRATINHLLNKVGARPEEILALGSWARVEIFGGHKIQIHTSNTLPEYLQPEIYFDFAFVTREQEQILGSMKYVEVNQKIISISETLLQNLKPKFVFLASSGAVYDSIEKNRFSTIYGNLKLEQEERIRIKCKEVGSALSICRIFNLSGSSITKPETFALADFLTSAQKLRKIVVNAQNEVLRRYCHDEELVALFLAMKEANFVADFDSGGYLVEIRELAQMVKYCVGQDVVINQIPINSKINSSNYFSKSRKYEELVKKYLGKDPKKLKEQIEETYEGIKKKNL